MGTRTEGSRGRRAEREKGAKEKESGVCCVVCGVWCVCVSGFGFRVSG